MVKKVKPKDEMEYRLTHPNKLFYPEDKITKAAVAEYYNAIHEWMIPYVESRPLTLVRCPENYKQCFYQKHLGHEFPEGLYGIMIKEKQKREKYIYIKDKLGLLLLTQFNVLEIHPWGSRIDNLEHPDLIIFDLDPATNLPWKEVVKAAFEIKALLQEIKLTSYVKTTGGKGLHVVIPIKPEYEWPDVKNFAHLVVDYMVMHNPTKYTAKISKKDRANKIFIDYLRNQRGATAIAPYSTRARIGGPVSVPLDWDELSNNIKDNQFNIKTLPKRLNKLIKDPWRDFLKKKQSLKLDKLK